MASKESIAILREAMNLAGGDAFATSDLRQWRYRVATFTWGDMAIMLDHADTLILQRERLNTP